MVDKIRFRVTAGLDDFLRAFAVRAIVFCEEQQIAYDLEHDREDHTAIHIVGEIGSEPVAAGRMRFIDGYAKLERLAVRSGYRGNGYGHRLTQFMIALAAARGFDECQLHAQVHLRDFYSKHGFVVKGAVFKEAGIGHLPMVRCSGIKTGVKY